MESYNSKHYHMSNKKDSKQNCSENNYNCDSISSASTANSCSPRYSSSNSSSNDSGVGNINHVRYTASGIICTANGDACNGNGSNENGAGGLSTGKVTSSRRGQKRSATLNKPKAALDSAINQRNVATLAVVHSSHNRRKSSIEIQSENR